MRKMRSSGKGSSNGVVDLAAGFQVAAERLLERHSNRRASEPGRCESVNGGLEQGRRRRQENGDAVAWVADLFWQPLEAGGIVDVERHVMKARQEALGDSLLEEARWEVLLQGIGR